MGAQRTHAHAITKFSMRAAATIEIKGTALPNTFSVLDASGRANPDPQMALSTVPVLLPALVGLRFIGLGVVTSGGGLLATNPVEWVFQ